METTPQISRGEFIILMRTTGEEVLGRVADSINTAPSAKIVSASEERVRDLLVDDQQPAFERSLQMRV